MKKINSKILTILFMPVICVELWASDLTYQGIVVKSHYSGEIMVDNSQFIYPSIEKLTFNTADYLTVHQPHLLPLRPAIDTWAAMLSIHPKLLTEVIDDFQKQLVTPNQINNQMVFEIASVMSKSYYKNPNNTLAASIALDTAANTFDFIVTLPIEFKSIKKQLQTNYFKGSTGTPLYGYLQPPWPRGENWSGGGVHGGGVKNALDFWSVYTAWDGDTSNYWVSAAQKGVARVWSTCGMTVIHPNGWETFYYHLDNIQVSDYDEISSNEQISNYADNEEQALCTGGSSTGPHIHLNVKYNGAPVAINEANLDFTSWKHHAGVGNYDFDCETSYYTMLPSQSIVCPGWRQLPNNGLPDLIFTSGFE